MSADYEAMLRRLCLLAGVPAAEQPLVVAQQAMLVDGMSVQFQLEPWSGFVKVYIDAGRPAPARLPALCQAVLEQQLSLPAPFLMLTALDAASGSLVLLGCAPLALDAGGDEEFFAFLCGCIEGAQALRSVTDAQDGGVPDLTGIHYP